MKKLYTVEEMLDDICQFEQARVQFPAMLVSSRFVTLYSQYYKSPIADKATVSDLQDKIERFLGDKSVHLLNPDVVPEESQKDSWLYGYIRNSEGTVFLGEFNEVDGFDDLIKGDAIAPYKVVMIISDSEDDIAFFTRSARHDH